MKPVDITLAPAEERAVKVTVNSFAEDDYEGKVFRIGNALLLH